MPLQLPVMETKFAHFSTWMEQLSKCSGSIQTVVLLFLSTPVYFQLKNNVLIKKGKVQFQNDKYKSSKDAVQFQRECVQMHLSCFKLDLIFLTLDYLFLNRLDLF